MKQTHMSSCKALGTHARQLSLLCLVLHIANIQYNVPAVQLEPICCLVTQSFFLAGCICCAVASTPPKFLKPYLLKPGHAG